MARRSNQAALALLLASVAAAWHPHVPPTRPHHRLRSPAATAAWHPHVAPIRPRLTVRSPAAIAAATSSPGGKVVLLTGFEDFNRGLYESAAAAVRDEVDVETFTDRDIGTERLEVALAEADVFFGSLVFDYDDVAWLTPRLERVRTRFIFESALELMSDTRVGTFTMAGGGGGPPAPVKALLSRFGSGKEEDKLAGYLQFLKVGPSLLKFVPGEKARDVRLWLEAYSYWNQGGQQNVQTMLRLLAQRLELPPPAAAAASTVSSTLPPPIETPAIGLVHPDAPGRYFGSLGEYEAWLDARLPAGAHAGRTVGVLLYRKHVVSGLPYIGQLIRGLEASGLRPLPVFINGVEGHTIVRDAFTTERKRELNPNPPASPLGSAHVDAVVNTIGFPLVGGPAGSMQAGRRVDVATDILRELGVPYIVAAPLLIQDAKSWREVGVQGLQQVVLYALPELDGAVDTVVLGGLEGDAIVLDDERVAKLGSRLNGWLSLRRKPPSQRRVAILLYGFPPNVGATGTAALLDVPTSLTRLLRRLKHEGYDLGPEAADADGETLVAALAALTQDAAIARGADGLPEVLELACSPLGGTGGKGGTGGGRATPARVDNAANGLGGATVHARAVRGKELRGWLGSELAARMEGQWGVLEEHRGLGAQQDGGLVCSGLQLGNVFIGVQPLLGIEGDPMRLMFERDLTPHPQYAAFYEWLWQPAEAGGCAADAVVHCGMHGTVEWLPGSPLGNTATSWPDKLLGGAPNVYLYAANNPSESILAKRRGYGTLVSYAAPPYARAGLYAELSRTRELIGEYRLDPIAEAPLRPTIADALLSAGLYSDMPPPASLLEHTTTGGADGASSALLDGEAVLAAEASLGPEALSAWAADFDSYIGAVYAYLAQLQERLFSEGLHVFGRTPDPAQALAYLDAYYGADALPAEALTVVSELRDGEGVREAASRLLALHPSRFAWAAQAAASDAAAAAAAMDALSGESLVPPAEAEDATAAWLQELALRADGFADKLGLELPKPLAAAAEQARLREADRAAAALASESERLGAELSSGTGLDGVSAAATEGEVLATADAAPTGGAEMARLLREAVDIRQRLARTSEELDAVVTALGGGYVAPGVGGDLLRDGPGVLPTGRNIHALDPFRIPSAAASARGALAAQKVLAAQVASSADGATWPETVAVTLWGLNEIKTRGESVAIVLELVGATAISEETGRVVKYQLKPLEELTPPGRPRIDVLASLSGIFRDSFAKVVELLDDLFEAAAEADEPPSRNFVRKHALELAAAGVERPASRLFSNPAGDYGSMVNEQVGAGEWEAAGELGDTWQGRNAYSFGRGDEARGTARGEVLEALLGTTGRVVQMIDSVEYGLTDIQEYYANTGALKTAAEGAGARRAAAGGAAAGGAAASAAPPRVGVSVVEAYSREVEPRELEATLRMEYRTKLLNPKWADAMAAQGSGGAYEISQRFTALIGWGATADFADDFVFDGAYDRYVGDEQLAARLTASNPEAVRNMVRRLLEAHGRGMWESASDEALARLRELYQEAEDVIELGGRLG